MARYDPKHMSWIAAAEMNEEMFGLSMASSTTREMAYVRRHPIEGQEPVAFYTHLDRPGGAGGGGAGGGNGGSGKSSSSKPGPSSSSGLHANGLIPAAAVGGGAGVNQRLGNSYGIGNGVAGGGGGGGGLGGGLGGENKASDFVCYSESEESEDEEDYSNVLSSSRRRLGGRFAESGDRVSVNFADCLQARELGLNGVGGGRFFSSRLSSEYGTRHMLSNSMLKETPIVVPHMNKVFCSQWLSDRQVVFGTKCNKLMVYDVNSRFMDQIPSLQSSENSPIPPGQECGIHAIEINPSGTLLATGAKNANTIAVYRLPTLDPICVGENAHQDWIFDLTWLDDQFLVSGSRDGTVALWRITEEMVHQVISSDIPSYVYARALTRKKCKTADKVRSMCFNARLSELAVISTNGFIHCWDGLRFRQRMSKRLPHNKDNVCLTVNDDSQLYAVGSKAHTDLLDTRTLQAVKKITSRQNCLGIRSVSFRGNILTIGTAAGTLLFWDLRAGKFLESTMNSNRAVQLKTSRSWTRMDNYVMHGGLPINPHDKQIPAFYTHCYDHSGTRLFAAGGPLQADYNGNCIVLFQ